MAKIMRCYSSEGYDWERGMVEFPNDIFVDLDSIILIFPTPTKEENKCVLHLAGGNRIEVELSPSRAFATCQAVATRRNQWEAKRRLNEEYGNFGSLEGEAKRRLNETYGKSDSYYVDTGEPDNSDFVKGFRAAIGVVVSEHDNLVKITSASRTPLKIRHTLRVLNDLIRLLKEQVITIEAVDSI